MAGALSAEFTVHLWDMPGYGTPTMTAPWGSGGAVVDAPQARVSDGELDDVLMRLDPEDHRARCEGGVVGSVSACHTDRGRHGGSAGSGQVAGPYSRATSGESSQRR